MDITQIRQEVANHIEEDNSSDSWSIGDSTLFWVRKNTFEDPTLPNYVMIEELSEWLTQFTDKEILDFYEDEVA
jgi:hypothetical protein